MTCSVFYLHQGRLKPGNYPNLILSNSPGTSSRQRNEAGNQDEQDHIEGHRGRSERIEYPVNDRNPNPTFHYAYPSPSMPKKYT